MNLLKSPLRRTTAAIAGTFIGLVGAVALASPASAHHPEIDATKECPTGANWEVNWSVTNVAPGDRQAEITSVKLVGENGQSLTAEQAPALKDLAVSKTIDANKTQTEKQVLPKTTRVVTLEITLDWHRNGVEPGTKIKTVRADDNCTPTKPEEPEQPKPPTEQPKPAAEPTPIVEMDCTTIVIGLDNPKDGVKITLTLETSKGEKRELTVKPGEKKTEKFSASEGFTVKVGAKEVEETTTIAYEKPEDCSAAGSGGGDELALTGANASTMAGIAGGVLLIGAALFFVARRRKVKFTA